ncbi:oligosaccharide flippase family protein [Acinetobacter higginsii]|uniref:oligosaccharide flippase family protein n=1 Tax=Acinetobacter higginsii TaxID=70347 RepID=UPI0026773E42|nr:oligosaccharide flippase family protein [Acinetobacter higginsii]MDO3666191.1 oligosaccharide flippase family protein [Acinetobacter higginsii]
MNLKTANIITLGSILGAAVSFCTVPIITWFFSQEDIGRFSMYQLALNLGMILISLDMHQAYVREYYETEQKEQLLKISLFSGSVVFAIVFLISEVLNFSLSKLLFNIESRVIDVFVLLGIYITFIINILVHVLRMHNFAWAFAFTQVIPKIGYIVVLGVGVYFYKNYNYNFLIYANIFVLLLSLGCLIFFLKKDLYKAIIIKLDRKKLNQMLAFSLPLVFGSLSYWALTSIDRVFLKNLSNYNELAIYAVASTLAGGIGVLVTVFSNLWHPIVYKWMEEGIDSKKVLAINELMVIFICLLWSFVGMFSWIVLYFFPQSYSGVASILVGCIAMPLLYMLSETTTIGIGLTRKTIYAMFATLIALILNISINYFLVEKYGAKATTIASMSAFTLFLILRTEFSSFLWMSLSRWRMYVAVLLYFSITLLIVLEVFSGKINNAFIWFLSLFFVLSLYFTRVKRLFESLRLRDFKW